MKGSVLIRKVGGFYNVFDDDAIIVSYLTGYKVVNGRCGFPINSLNKVINIFEDNKINYIVREGMNDINKKNYKKNNRYDNVFVKTKKKYDIDYRINFIMDKISGLSYDRLCSLLDVIEDYCSE